MKINVSHSMKTTLLKIHCPFKSSSLPVNVFLVTEWSLNTLMSRYPSSDQEYETPRGYHHPDSYYDDDEQPLYHESYRSPKRRRLPPTPQGRHFSASNDELGFA